MRTTAIDDTQAVRLINAAAFPAQGRAVPHVPIAAQPATRHLRVQRSVPDRPPEPAPLRDIQDVLRSFVSMGRTFMREVRSGSLSAIRQRSALNFLATQWVVPRKDQKEAANRLLRTAAGMEQIHQLHQAVNHWVEQTQAELDAAVAANNHARVDAHAGHATENNPDGLHTDLHVLNRLIYTWNEIIDSWPFELDRAFLQKHANVLDPAPDTERVGDACLPPWLQDVNRRGPRGGPPPPPGGGTGSSSMGVSASVLGRPTTRSAYDAYYYADDRTRARYFEYGVPVNHNVNMRRFDFADHSSCITSSHIPQETQDFMGHRAIWQGYTTAYYLTPADVAAGKQWGISYSYGWKGSSNRLLPVPLDDRPQSIADCYNFATRSDLFDWYPWKSGTVEPREPRFDHCGSTVERIEPPKDITQTALEPPPANDDVTQPRVRRSIRTQAESLHSAATAAADGLVQAMARLTTPPTMGVTTGVTLATGTTAQPLLLAAAGHG